MTGSAYSLIPTDRPESVDELVSLYGLVVEHCARHYYKEYYDYRQSLDDLRQDAWFGILRAWQEYKDDRNMVFKTFAVQMARWYVLNGMRHYDKAAFNAWRTDKKLYLRILQTDSFERIQEALGDHFDFPAMVDEPACALPFKHLLSMIKSQRVRYILEQYYGYERTMDDIGSELGVSRERIRQIMNEAYLQIRLGLEKKKRNPFEYTS